MHAPATTGPAACQRGGCMRHAPAVPRDDRLPDPVADDARALVSGPLPATDVERLLRLLDERVRLRATARAVAVDVPAADAGDAPMDPAAAFGGASLRGLAAPRFHIE